MTGPGSPPSRPEDATDRLEALCAVLHATLAGVDCVGVLGPDRRTLLSVFDGGREAGGASVAPVVASLLSRLGDRESSPETSSETARAGALDVPTRLLVTLGSARLLVRSAGVGQVAEADVPPGVLFLYGPVTALRADAWALVDATARLAGALLQSSPGTDSRGTD